MENNQTTIQSHENYITKLLADRLNILSGVKKGRNEEKSTFEYIVYSLDTNKMCIQNNISKSDLSLNLNFDIQYIIDDSVLYPQMVELAKILQIRITDFEILKNLDEIIIKVSNSEISIISNPMVHEVFRELLEEEQ